MKHSAGCHYFLKGSMMAKPLQKIAEGDLFFFKATCVWIEPATLVCEDHDVATCSDVNTKIQFGNCFCKLYVQAIEQVGCKMYNTNSDCHQVAIFTDTLSAQQTLGGGQLSQLRSAPSEAAARE
ncbi:hypothetical protein BsWGS_22516 [Bradybaena similaris]